jgi:hypothetical protein
VNNIELDLGYMGGGVVDFVGLAQVRKKWRAVVNAVMNFQVP